MPKKICISISEEQGRIITEVIKSQEKKVIHVGRQIKGLNLSQFYHFLNGVKSIRREFVDDLYAILNHDERLKFLCNISGSSKQDYFSSDFDKNWRNLYDSYSLRLRNILSVLPNKTRIQLISDLEALTDKYISESCIKVQSKNARNQNL